MKNGIYVELINLLKANRSQLDRLIKEKVVELRYALTYHATDESTCGEPISIDSFRDLTQSITDLFDYIEDSNCSEINYMDLVWHEPNKPVNPYDCIHFMAE